jgi:predicted translin family RNA/ssDNA-binding protein
MSTNNIVFFPNSLSYINKSNSEKILHRVDSIRVRRRKIAEDFLNGFDDFIGESEKNLLHFPASASIDGSRQLKTMQEKIDESFRNLNILVSQIQSKTKEARDNVVKFSQKKYQE